MPVKRRGGPVRGPIALKRTEPSATESAPQAPTRVRNMTTTPREVKLQQRTR